MFYIIDKNNQSYYYKLYNNNIESYGVWSKVKNENSIELILNSIEIIPAATSSDIISRMGSIIYIVGIFKVGRDKYYLLLSIYENKFKLKRVLKNNCFFDDTIRKRFSQQSLESITTIQFDSKIPLNLDIARLCAVDLQTQSTDKLKKLNTKRILEISGNNTFKTPKRIKRPPFALKISDNPSTNNSNLKSHYATAKSFLLNQNVTLLETFNNRVRSDYEFSKLDNIFKDSITSKALSEQVQKIKDENKDYMEILGTIGSSFYKNTNFRIDENDEINEFEFKTIKCDIDSFVINISNKKFNFSSDEFVRVSVLDHFHQCLQDKV